VAAERTEGSPQSVVCCQGRIEAVDLGQEVEAPDLEPAEGAADWGLAVELLEALLLMESAAGSWVACL
jgi:hypothetical protein